MKNLESFQIKIKFLIIPVLILIPHVVFLPKSGFGFFPLNWSDLNFQMRYQAQWYRVRLENRIEIFDPFENKMGEMGKKNPKFMPERDYVQIITWKRDQVLVIETRNDEGQLMHLYYEIGDQTVQKQIDPIRFFNLNEIMPHYLRFLTKKIRTP